jgi:hypothetical protein
MVEQLLFTFCTQPNGCRSWRWAEEKTTGGSGHDRDQEVEKIVRVSSLRVTVGELATVGGSERKRRRKSTEGRGKTSQWLPLSPVSGFVGRLHRRLLVERKAYVGSSTAEDVVEREREMKCAETGKQLVFWLTFDQIFSPLRA